MAIILLIIIYMAFISLGLPDSLFGVSWPLMHIEFQLDNSFASVTTIIVALGTIWTSFFTGKIIRKFGTGKVTAFSVLLTAVALLGISISNNIWVVIAFSIPLGIGAGAVDGGLNNLVANHYKPYHMSWLHCFWGVGVTVSPLIMSRFLEQGTWRGGYQTISILQFCLTAILFLSLPLWSKVEKKSKTIAPLDDSPFQNPNENDTFNTNADGKTLTDNTTLLDNTNIKDNDLNCDNKISTEQNFENTTKNTEIQNKLKNAKFNPFKVNGIFLSLFAFAFYCGMENIIGTWGASFLINTRHITPDVAARWISLYFGGIMVGRLITGFLTMKLSDKTIIRLGEAIAILGILLLFINNSVTSLVGLMAIGIGYAPLFPCFIHATPFRFVSKYSPDIIGYQMGFAYIGIVLLQPLFGLIASKTTFLITPYVLIAFAVIVVILTEILNKLLQKNNNIPLGVKD